LGADDIAVQHPVPAVSNQLKSAGVLLAQAGRREPFVTACIALLNEILLLFFARPPIRAVKVGHHGEFGLINIAWQVILSFATPKSCAK